MKATELIAQLQKIVDEKGDLPVRRICAIERDGQVMANHIERAFWHDDVVNEWGDSVDPCICLED